MGAFYPAARQMETNGVDGYVLSTLELIQIAQQLRSKPLTYEHVGIAGACEWMERRGGDVSTERVVAGLNAAAQADLLGSPIGVVLDAWRAADGTWLCSFAIDHRTHPRLCALVDSGTLRGLSLSHYHGILPEALEVSLCSTPARPGCSVTAGPFDAPDGLRKYKARSLSVASPHPCLVTMSALESPPADMSDVLKQLTPENRKLISAAFASMDAELATVHKTNASLKNAAASVLRSEDLDKRLLTSQLETLLSQFDEQTKERHNISMQTCKDGIVDENNASAMRRNFDRVLLCCNSALMQQKADGTTGSKRKRDPGDTDGTGEANAAPPTFEPFASPSPVADTTPDPQSTPASALRAALAAFD